MSRSVTLLQLRTDVRRAADMENSQFVSDTELNRYINQSVADLYDLLLRNMSEEWGVSPDAYTVYATGSVQTYNLPSDFLKLRGVDRLVGSDWEALDKVPFEERNSTPEGGWNTSDWYGYNVVGNRLMLLPAPRATAQLRLWYVPAFGALSADSDLLDGVDGWEEYVVVDAAIKCLLKEQSDVTVLMGRKMELKQRIAEGAEERDIGGCPVIRDVRGGWSLSSWR